MVRAVRYFKGLDTASEDRASTAVSPACETLDNMSQLLKLFEGFNRPVGGEHAGI